MVWVIVGIIAAVVIIGIIVAVAASGRSEDYHDRGSSNYHSSGLDTSSSDLHGEVLTPEEYKGYAAERSIAILLDDISSKIDNSFLINNVTIPSGKDKNGKQRTIEIDHVLFTPSGLFIIETKSRAGTIYGDEEDDEWSQVLGWEDEIEHTFFNPIKQNDIHIRVLKRLLRNDRLVCYSCIVFEDGDISNVDCNIVITPEELEDFIFDCVGDNIYNPQDLRGIYTRIQYYKEHPPVTKEEHIKNVHSRNDYDA